VLKTAGWGYDGKGQTRITSLTEAEKAYRALNGEEAVLEKFVDLEREVSVVARGADGQTIDYGVIENVHRKHILDTSIAPANLPAQLCERAIEIAHSILEQLQIIGVLCVEFFSRATVNFTSTNSRRARTTADT
jgi:5-(carboxyamino)imidazole ribonucleotide synthase